MRFILTAIASQCILVALAQQPSPSFINSGDTIRLGIEHFDKQEFETAITKYNVVHPNDTNFGWAMYEKCLALYNLKRFDEAIEVGTRNIKSGYNDPMQYSVIGSAYDESERRDKALLAYAEGLKKYPLNSNLLFNRAVVYELMKDHGEALNHLQENLRMNPVSLSDHARVAKYALRQGYYTEAMMASAVYLILEPAGSKSLGVLQFMEKAGNSDVKDLDPISPVGPNEFKDIDFIITNKIALADKYKTPSEFNISVIKQLYAVLEKVKDMKKGGDGFFGTYYWPFFKDLSKREDFKNLALLLLASVNDESVSKPLTKRIEEIKKLRTELVELWTKHHTSYKMTRDGKDWQATISIDPSTLKVDGYYTSDETGKRNGYAEAYNAQGSMEGKGNYKDDKHDGVWTFYYRTGEKYSEVSVKEDKRDGPYTQWYRNGTLKEKGTNKNGEMDGEFKTYHSSGALRVQGTLKDGKQIGAGSKFYNTGSPEMEYTYKDGELDGMLREFYAIGPVYAESNYTVGKVNGVAKQFFVDGKVYDQKNFINGNIDGEFKKYYQNGKVQNEGKAVANNAVGEWKYYYPNGKLEKSRLMDDKGRDHGASTSYAENGVAYYTETYDHGQLKNISVQKPDGTGKKDWKVGKQPQEVEFYDQNGTVSAKGQLANTGREGKWEDFAGEGYLKQSATFKAGNQEGVVSEFFATGGVETTISMKNGVREGLFTDYFYNGKVLSTGNYVEGKKWQEWIDFNNDGTLAAKYWYQNDELIGKQQYYDVLGKESLREYYNDEGFRTAIVVIDTNGNAIDSVSLSSGFGKVSTKHRTGYAYQDAEFVGGIKHGTFTWHYPNGKLFSTGKYNNGYTEGFWITNYPNGNIKDSGNYVFGKRAGVWNTFGVFGTLVTSSVYEYGDRHGLSKYFLNGKIEKSEAYEYGRLHGSTIYFTPDSSIQVVKYYHDGVLVGYSYEDAAHKLLPMIPLKNASGQIAAKFANGKPSYTCMVKNGYIEGAEKRFYTNGQLADQRNYQNSQLDGEVKAFFPDGKIMTQAVAKSGRYHGPYNTFHPNGKPKSIGAYYLDRRHGEFKYIDENGKMVLNAIYYDDDAIKILN